MFYKLNIVISIIFFLLTTFIYTGYSQEKLISVKKQLKDFEQLVAFIEAHPDPYSASSEKMFSQKINQIEESITKPISVLDFYKKTASLVAIVKDGHSSVHLPRYWLEKKRKKNGAFPYKMFLSNDDKLFVVEKYNNGDIPIRANIVAINGISVDSFLNIIDPYISYELKPFRNTIIDANFEKYLYLALNSSTDINLTYTKNGVFNNSTIKNMPFKAYKAYIKKNTKERDKLIKYRRPYTYKKVKNGVGLLKIYQFSADLTKFQFFLTETFKEIRNDSIHSLIIDVRGNFGGRPKISSVLFHYISEGHFKSMAKSSLKISNTFRTLLNKSISGKSAGHRFTLDFGQHNRHSIDLEAIMFGELGTFKEENALYNESPVSRENEFRGDTYLLTNRDSYSAASSFAATFQCYQMGIIVGEETGGTKIFRANAIYKKLPKSKIAIQMSTSKLYTTCYSDKTEGIHPTIQYTPTILERVSDLDTQLYYTVALIKRIQKERLKAN